MLAGSYRRFHPKTRLNDALIESCTRSLLIHKEKRGLPGLPFIIFCLSADGAGEGTRPSQRCPSPGLAIQGTPLNPYMARPFIGLSVFCQSLWERYRHEKGRILATNPRGMPWSIPWALMNRSQWVSMMIVLSDDLIDHSEMCGQ